MVHVTNRSHVYMRLRPLKFPFGHQKLPKKTDPRKKYGAHNRIRTGDLFLTKEVLYRLSYVGLNTGAGDGNRTHTISLEG